MANIFSSVQALKGAFKADLGRLLVNGQSAGLLIQNMNFSFSQQVSMLYEVGSSDVYYVVGRATGQAGISRIIGPIANNIAFLTKFGDGCQAPTNQIQIQAQGGCTGAAINAIYQLDGCLINNLSGSIASQDMLINEQIQMVYVNLSLF